MSKEVKIQWVNKYSKEKGYVAGISLKEGHIMAAQDFESAKSYASSSAKGLINTLAKRNIDQQNDYILVPANPGCEMYR